MKHSSKGQVAAEFMIYVGIFMFVAIVAFVVISQVQAAEVPYHQNKVAREIGEGFVNVVTLSVRAGPGFSYNYTYPKSIFNHPYEIYLTNLSDGNFMLLQWAGPYGNVSFNYDVPAYDYKLEGTCLSNKILISDRVGCQNMLMFYNDGENLTISQG